MHPSELTIEVRDRSLDRVGLILPQYWSDVTLISRLRGTGEWKLSLPAELPIADDLRRPGAGILVSGPNGTLFSGLVTQSTRSQSTEDPTGTIDFEGVDDNVLLDDATAWPDPASAAAAQRDAYDVRSGPGESVIRSYVDRNIGPAALAGRRGLLAQRIVLSPDLGRGTTVSASARHDNLAELASTLGALSGVAYRIAQSGDALVLEFWEPVDKTKLIRLDIMNGRLSASDSSIASPTATHAIVMGQGEGAARQILERSSADSRAASAAWGRRIEVVKDQRNTDDLNELAQAGDELLVDGGRTRTETKITPTDGGSMQFGRDWQVGDRVSVVVGDVEVPEIITAAAIGITKTGVRIAAKVGESE